MIRNTAARVRHGVSADRRRLGYFLRRCYWEGRSKAVLAGRVGTEDGLSSERTYLTRTLTTGVIRSFASAAAGRPAAASRGLAIIAGFAATGWGYTQGQLTARPTSAPRAAEPAERAETTSRTTAPSAWEPLVLSEYRLPGPDHQVSKTPGSRTRLLVTSGGSPLGLLDLAVGEEVPAPHEVAERLSLPDSGTRTPSPEFLGSSDFTPTVSVIIPTRGRSFELLRCVRSVLASDYQHFEVLVVDNNDRPGAVEELLEPLLRDDRLRVLHQPERGVSPARNLGIAQARGEIIAATDDDVVVTPQWLSEIVAPLADPTIACVSGLVLPNGFSAPAQEMFEEFGGFSKGFQPARYDLEDHRSPHVLYPYSPGIYGSGNNLAYRRDLIASLGGYDSRLGPGTPARAGEDLDLFLKVLFSGGSIYYQPRAWVRHDHRHTIADLRRQLRDYGRGLSAVMVIWALSDPRRALDIALRLPAGLRHLFDPKSGKNKDRSADYPVELRRSEMRGMVEGLLLTAYGRLRHPSRGRTGTAGLVLRPAEAVTSPTVVDHDQEISRHAL
jgi:glycosyltransferase involved in cell wall biosynthesis